MKIDEILYHLQHYESLTKINENELNQLLTKYPYLESLRNSIAQNSSSGNPAVGETDLQSRFIRLAAQAYNRTNDGTGMLAPVFDIELPKMDSIHEEPAPDEAENLNTSPAHLESGPRSQSSYSQELLESVAEQPFRLYPYEPSDFIKFLQTLPSCTVYEHEPTGHPISSQDLTDQYIASSTQLHLAVGSESLANLWASQGKYEDAIKMYEILASEIPEKSSTFAAKIAKLKTEKSL